MAGQVSEDARRLVIETLLGKRTWSSAELGYVMRVQDVARILEPLFDHNYVPGLPDPYYCARCGRSAIIHPDPPARPPVPAPALPLGLQVVATPDVPKGEFWVFTGETLHKFKLERGELEEIDRVYRAEEPPR